ncbi:hypothetical protein [Leifsonia sp. Root227]|uniref:hypothetical protein n=1 Tax=Leifsonia sp. Root227 TaxID=1736496 RepID=UPI000A6EE33B|nr:hypothetical protein [Leifsonia sp. Root227]
MSTELAADRDTALRAVLVETSAEEGRRAPRRRRRWMLGVGAFALAGALTGAAITTTAIASADQANRVFRLGAAAEQQVKTHGILLGAPVVADASGTARLALRSAPPGATRLAVSLECFDDGQVVASVAGVSETVDCSVDTPAVTELSAPVGPQQTVTVAAAAGGRILAWASWMRDRPVPAASAQQNADLSDGRVTHAEYLAAYSRYAGCMAEAGYPMAPVTGAPPFVFYAVPDAAVDAGADGTCYAREFAQVDRAWQSTLSDLDVTCLAEHGVDGARLSIEQQLAELRRLGLLQACLPSQE